MDVRTIRTESGAVYEFRDHQVRRVNPHHLKRGDGEWQNLLDPLPEGDLVGLPLILTMSSLARYGADDVGTVNPSEVTYRTTTRVVEDTEQADAS